MCDIADEAAALELQMIEVALANRERPSMTFTGACRYCEEKVDKGFLCCPECKDDYERIERAQQHRKVA